MTLNQHPLGRSSFTTQISARSLIPIILLFLLAAFDRPLCGQSFVELSNSFPAVARSSAAWGDYDNDGRLDLVICGSESNGLVTRLYHNDGDGVFHEIQAKLPGILGSLAWGDYDNDGDLDLLLSGLTNEGIEFADVFRNDGNGIFTPLNLNLQGGQVGSATWVDCDNDGDLDILLFGQNNSSQLLVRLYRNDGRNSFTTVSTSLPPGSYTSATWGDFDNDGDSDLLLASSFQSGAACRVYRNDSPGDFVDIQAGLDWSFDGSVAWGDYDNDGKLDILQTGSGGPSLNGITQLYHNDGNGAFTALNPSLPQLYDSYIAWADYDNDGLLDIGLCGFGGPAVAGIFRNLGQGTFGSAISPGEGLGAGWLGWADFDNDGKLDLLVSGINGQGIRATHLYRNLTTISNSPPTAPSGLKSTVTGTSVALSWSPATDSNQTNGLTYNLRVGSKPGMQDVLSPMADLTTGFRRISQAGPAGAGCVWKLNNLKGGTYYWSVQCIDHAFAGSPFATEASFHINEPPTISPIANQFLAPKASTPALAFTISDPESSLDSLRLSFSSSNTNTVPLQNIVLAGAGSNRTVTVTAVDAPIGGSTITLTVTDPEGETASASFRVSVAPFTELELNLPGYNMRPALDWADFDNDGWLDFVLSGNNGADSYSASNGLYRNLGGTNFVLLTNTFPAFQQGSLAAGDYDNDGYLDLLVAGYGSNLNNSVFHNGGNWNFGLMFSGLPFYDATVAWADFDNDGRLDFAASGWNSSSYSTSLYKQGDCGGFCPFVKVPAAVWGTLAWADFDNDGDWDLLTVGHDGAHYGSRLYRNVGKGGFVDSGIVLQPGWYAAAWGDYDNDGDPDLLLSRQDSLSGGQRTLLYRNDGTNGFVESPFSLPGIQNGSLAWGDYNNDGLLDILMTGASPAGALTRIYRNNGNGTFSDIQADLAALDDGRAVWGDFDNDGNLDILLTGSTNGTRITRVYHNDLPTHNAAPEAPTGLSSFLRTNTAVLRWQVAHDPNQSGGLTYNLRIGTSPGAADILSPMADLQSGHRRLPQRGNADENLRWPIRNLRPGIYYWSVQAIDNSFAGSPFAPEQTFVMTAAPFISINADVSIHANTSAQLIFTVSDLETPADNLLLTASSSDTNLVPNANLVASGTGTNRVLVVTPIADKVGTSFITVTVTDAEGNDASSYFFLNVSNAPPALSSIADQSIFLGTSLLSIPFTVDDIETPASALFIRATSSNPELVPPANLVITGSGTNRSIEVRPTPGHAGVATITVYVTDSGGVDSSSQFQFSVSEFKSVPISLPGLDWSSAAWGDYDNDGNLDLLVAGSTESNLVTAIYHNNGDGTFTDIQAGFPGVRLGALAWGDYDNDGQLDVLLTGSTTGFADGALSRIYHNNGNGTFSDIHAGLVPAFLSSAVWGDFDNDGHLDVILAGANTLNSVCQIYRNNGNGTFSFVDVNLPALYSGSIALADYNRDGRIDLLLLGYPPSPFCQLLRNDGDFVFTDLGPLFSASAYASVAWGDYDSDGLLDIIVSTIPWADQPAQIYHNNGSDAFVAASYAPGFSNGSTAWGDYDNDGKPDLLMTGDRMPGKASVVLRNNGDGTFTNSGSYLDGVTTGMAVWGDYDNDGRLDIFLTGNSTGQVSRLYQNLSFLTNSPPSAPSALSVSISNNSVHFSWNAAQDAQTASSGLSYNLRIGTAPGAQDVVSPSAAPDGRRRLVGLGDVGPATTFTLYDPPISGTYYWSVQAIDAGFAGSPFAQEQSFSSSFPPMARTLPATEVHDRFANLNGLVNAKGNPTTVWYEFGTTSAFGNATPLSALADTVSNVTFTVALTNIVPESDCYFRLVASNSLGVSFGQPLVFYAGNPPLITARPPTQTNQTSVTLQTSVNPNHSAAAVWFEYGLSTNYENQSELSLLPSYIPSSSVSLKIFGLLPGSLYHFRVVATNDFGTRYGEDQIFTTTTRPIVLTGSASDISFHDATLIAQVNPASKSTVGYFEYGLTTNYGSITVFTNLGDGLLSVPLTQPIQGLLPGATYHFRAVAVNSSATVAGADKSFVTRSPFTNSLVNLGQGRGRALIAAVDFNNDNRLDVALNGVIVPNTKPTFRLYRNDGAAGFTELNPGIPGVNYGAMAWGDFNNDGRQDLLLCGSTNSVSTGGGIITHLYRNDGNGVFTPIATTLPGVWNSAAAWADINGDGLLDIVLAGSTNNNNTRLICSVYINQGDESFTNYNANLPGILYGSISCADFNNDGRVDILLGGVTNVTGRPFTAVFRNNANRLFSRISAGIVPTRASATAWGDFDGDGAPDILVVGTTDSVSAIPSTKIYRNNGNETFSDIGASLPNLSVGSVAWGDFDDDGRLDALLVGTSSYSETYIAAVCKNLGNSTFAVLNPGFRGIANGSAAWGDFDHDGKLDVLLAGMLTSSGSAISAIYQNLLNFSNTPPTSPNNLTAIASASGAIFRWNSAFDIETSSNSLTYNLRIGTSPGGEEVMAAAADTNGLRRLVERGNVGQRTLWQVSDFPASGTFFWSVQAIDNSYAGSPFAAEQMFILPGVPTVTPVPTTNVSTQSVVLNGLLNANGYSGVAWFEWGLTQDYGNTSNLFPFDSATVLQPLAFSLTNLAPQTVYHWRLVATNSAGRAFTTDRAFAIVSPETPPQFTGFKFLSPSEISLSLQGPADVTCHIYASVNLRNWTLLAIVTNNILGTSQFTDRTATIFPSRFYRFTIP